MISISIPIEPVPFSRPRFNNGRGFNSKKYSNFKNSLSILMKTKYREVPLSGALEVCLVFSLEKGKSVKREYPEVRPDLDNFVKAVFDSANLILWNDDAQVVDLHAFKVYGEPRITITVKQKREI